MDVVVLGSLLCSSRLTCLLWGLGGGGGGGGRGGVGWM